MLRYMVEHNTLNYLERGIASCSIKTDDRVAINVACLSPRP